MDIETSKTEKKQPVVKKVLPIEDDQQKGQSKRERTQFDIDVDVESQRKKTAFGMDVDETKTRASQPEERQVQPVQDQPDVRQVQPIYDDQQ